MEKTLELVFVTEAGKTSRLTVMEPKENLLAGDIKAAMDQIIEANVFLTESGPFVSAKEARLVERSVQVYPFE